MKNLFQDIPHPLQEEVFETLAQHKCVQIERIISYGHITPEDEWYDQGWDEFVVLLKGQARLAFANRSEEITLNIGDYICINAYEKHRVSYTPANEETIWLAIHFGDGLAS